MLKLELYDKNKTALVFERTTYSTSSPYTIKINNSDKTISVKSRFYKKKTVNVRDNFIT